MPRLQAALEMQRFEGNALEDVSSGLLCAFKEEQLFPEPRVKSQHSIASSLAMICKYRLAEGEKGRAGLSLYFQKERQGRRKRTPPSGTINTAGRQQAWKGGQIRLGGGVAADTNLKRSPRQRWPRGSLGEARMG